MVETHVERQLKDIMEGLQELIFEEVGVEIRSPIVSKNDPLNFGLFSTACEDIDFLQNLLETVAWILRFAKLAPKKTTYLIATEIDQADREICKWVQLEHFLDEINCLRHGKPISKRSSIYKLVPYLDVDGLLRVKGRLDEALYLPHDACRPIILPHSHWVSQLIMAHYHIKNHPQNMCLTINELRDRYWIPRIITQYNRVKRNCTVCKMDVAKPIIRQMGQLPPDRITPYVRPFTYTGVDLCGPFNVSIGRRREKYGQ
ncbi:uncharacterized protein LOC142235478 [Haematobia irritans]|uniref:uncharacterized protein LOC142235478 n=1 Tax=Haematobia irritans TaxID=7368 RepID=UPI003F4F5CAC